VIGSSPTIRSPSVAGPEKKSERSSGGLDSAPAVVYNGVIGRGLGIFHACIASEPKTQLLPLAAAPLTAPKPIGCRTPFYRQSSDQTIVLFAAPPQAGMRQNPGDSNDFIVTAKSEIAEAHRPR